MPLYWFNALQVVLVPNEQLLPAGQAAQAEPVLVYVYAHNTGTAEAVAQLYPIN